MLPSRKLANFSLIKRDNDRDPQIIAKIFGCFRKICNFAAANVNLPSETKKVPLLG